MKVYVVSEICDDEYFCTDILFITANEELAERYCKENSKKEEYWDGIVRETITYREYEIINDDLFTKSE